MALSFNEYILYDALYFNLTCKHTRDRNNAGGRPSTAPLGTSKKIILFDGSIKPYPANAIDNTRQFIYETENMNPYTTATIYDQAFDSNVSIEDNGTRIDVRDDKMYFNTVLFSAKRSGKIDWFLVATQDVSTTEESISFISDSVGIPGTNSLLTISTSTVTSGQSAICWFNLSII